MRSNTILLAVAAGLCLGASAVPSEDVWKLSSSAEAVEIISQTKQRHSPVVVIGDRDVATARARAEPLMKFGHPVYILTSCDERDILELTERIVKKHDLSVKFDVVGPACFPAAKVYRETAERKLIWRVRASDTPDGFTSEELITQPTKVRASRAFARRIAAPVSVKRTSSGGWLVDFGRHAFGWAETAAPVAVRGMAGERLTSAGSIDAKVGSAVRSAEVRCKAGDGWRRLVFKTEIFSRGRCMSVPRELGEVMPMRYLEFPADCGFTPSAENVRMVALEYPFDETESGFSSSDAKLDRVYDFCKYSIRACCFGGIYIDGDRERLPYEADAYVTQLANYAMSSDYEVSRITHDYLMPYPTWPTEYKQISVLMAWTYWMWSGRDDLLRKYYEQLRDEKMMERFRRDSDGLLETGGEMFYGAYEGAADMVDWPKPERFGFEFRKVNAVVNAYYYICLNKMTQIAAHLGHSIDAARFSGKTAKVYQSFQKAFFDEKRGLYVDGDGATHVSIHANAIAVVAGLVPESRLKGVGDWLASREMECSVYFAQHFLDALFMTGHGARAVELMTAENDRSWIGMLNSGATITKESWNDAVKANIDWNHSWGAAAIGEIARNIAGVTPGAAGFASVRIAPDPAGLSRFEAKVPTAKGPVTVRYAKMGDGERLSVDTPVEAVVEFRGKSRRVGAGTYDFSGSALCCGAAK